MTKISSAPAVSPRMLARAQAQAEIVALREVASLATCDPVSGDTLPSILDSLRRVIACDGASVLVREGGEARIAAVHGRPVAVLNHRYTISEQATLHWRRGVAAARERRCRDLSPRRRRPRPAGSLRRWAALRE